MSQISLFIKYNSYHFNSASVIIISIYHFSGRSRISQIGGSIPKWGCTNLSFWHLSWKLHEIENNSPGRRGRAFLSPLWIRHIIYLLTVTWMGFSVSFSLFENQIACLSWVIFVISSHSITGPLVCRDPGFIEGATPHEYLIGYPMGAIRNYICRTGYTGGGAIVCQSNGQWTGPRPTCNRMNFYIIFRIQFYSPHRHWGIQGGARDARPLSV